VFGRVSEIAHQGGWDEVLLVAGPMVVVGWLLWVAKRRVGRAGGGAGVGATGSGALDAGTDRRETTD
jgi:hypothetical protein